MKKLIFLLALLPLMLGAQVQNTRLAERLLLSVQGGLPGANLVTNGDFSHDDHWTKGTGWTIANNKATLSGTTTAAALKQSILTSGKTYSVSITVSDCSSANFMIGDDNVYWSPIISANGTYQYTHLAAASGNFGVVALGTSSQTFSVTNIVIRELNSSALALPNPAYNLTNTSAIPTYGHKGGSSYLAFDGVDDIMTYAFTTASSSFVLWIRPTTTNKLWINMGTNMTIGIDGSNNLVLGSSLTNPVKYVNGSVSNAVTLNQWNYIVIKSDTITPTTLQFGYVSSSYGAFDLKGFMPFNYGLDATMAAYYSNPANHLKAVDQAVTGSYCVLSITPESFISPTLIRDYYHSVDIALSGATAPRLVRGELSAWLMNGTTSVLSKTGASDGLTGDVTLSAWIFPTSFGLEDVGMIFWNDAIYMAIETNQWVRQADLMMSRDGTTTVIGSAANSIVLNQWSHLVVTSTSLGVTNFYVNGILNGTANQLAGTPISGVDYCSGSITEGNKRPFKGVIENLQISKSIWPIETIQLAAGIYQ